MHPFPSSRTLWTSPCLSCHLLTPHLPDRELPSPLCRAASSHCYCRTHGTAFGAAPCDLPVPVGDDGARWDLAMGHQPPQGDQELPGQSHKAQLAHSSPLHTARLIPSAQVTRWLPVQPSPSQCDHEPPQSCAARFTDALLALRLPRVIRG